MHRTGTDKTGSTDKMFCIPDRPSRNLPTHACLASFRLNRKKGMSGRDVNAN